MRCWFCSETQIPCGNDKKGEGEKQIPFGNDRKKGKSETQIPCGNDKKKTTAS
jgi:hypothetical protein